MYATGIRALTLVVGALVASWAGAWSLAGSPYGAVVDDLLQRFHARERACGVAVVPAEACFVVEPSRASQLAEALEDFLAEHPDAAARGGWTSANGTHRVAITLPDAAWGALELWLTEHPDHRVEGRFRHLPGRQW